MGFADYKNAAAMRDAIEQIATGVVQRVRPETRIAKVKSINPTQLTAEVSFAGDTGSVNARYGVNQQPRSTNAIVRIAGSAGNYYITEILNEQSIVGAYEPVKEAFDDGSLTNVPPTDGLPPSGSPVPVVTPGIKFLLVEWAASSNADSTTYRLYVSATTPVVANAANLYATTPATSVVVNDMPDGSALSFTSPTYVAVIAFDKDGDGPLSAEASGTPRLIQTIDFSPGSVNGDALAAAAVTTAKIGSQAVDVTKLADGSVSAIKIIDGAVGTTKLVDAAVTVPKLNIAIGGGNLLNNSSFEKSDSYAAAVLANNPVGYWRLGEISGTVAADSSGQGRNGTYFGTPMLGQTGALVSDPDKAVRFNGTANQHAIIPNFPSYAAEFSTEAWVYLDNDGDAEQAIIEKVVNEVTNTDFLLFTFDSGTPTTLYWRVVDDSNALRDVTALVTRGAWHHVAGVQGGNIQRLYLDGVQVASQACTRTIAKASGNLWLARLASASGYALKGTLDEPAVYDRALTAAEVKKHYDAGRVAPKAPINWTANNASVLSTTLPNKHGKFAARLLSTAAGNPSVQQTGIPVKPGEKIVASSYIAPHQYAGAAVSTNLITNPSFEIDTAGWEGLNKNLLTANQSSAETSNAEASVLSAGTIARTTVQSLEGAASYVYTAGTTAVDGFYLRPGGPTTSAPVIPGQVYTVIASAKAATTPRGFRCRVYWYDSAGVDVSNSQGIESADNTAGWTQARYIVQAPVGAVYCTVAVVFSNLVNGEGHYVDAVSFTETPNANLVSNSDFENNIDGWTANGTGAVLAHDRTQSYTGTSSAKVTAGEAVARALHTVSTISGQTYTVSAYVKAVAGRRVEVLAYRATSLGQKSVSASGVWERIEVSFVADASTVNIYIGYTTNGTPGTLAVAGEVVNVDAVQVVKGSAALPYLPPSTTNLVPNPSVEVDAVGYGPKDVTVTRSIAWSAVGVASVELKANGVSTDGFASVNGDIGGIRLGMQAGKTYTVSATINTPVALTGPLNARARRIVVFWTNGSNGYPIFESAQGPVTGSARLSVTFALPSDAKEAFVRLYNGSPTLNEIVYWDAVQLEHGSVATPYVDGSLGAAGYAYNAVSGYSWDSSENISPNPGVEVDTANWGGNLVTLSRDTTVPDKDGVAALKAVHNGTAGDTYVQHTGFNLVPNTTYTVSFWVRADVNADWVNSYVQENGGGFRDVGSSAGSGALVANTWKRIVTTFTTLSDWFGATRLIIRIPEIAGVKLNGTNGNFWIDAVQIEQRPFVTPINQTGAANASTSTRRTFWTLGGTSVDAISRTQNLGGRQGSWEAIIAAGAAKYLTTVGYEGKSYGVQTGWIAVGASTNYVLSTMVYTETQQEFQVIDQAGNILAFASPGNATYWDGSRWSLAFTTLAGTTSIRVRALVKTGNTGYFYIDAVLLEAGTVASSYFDGDTPDTVDFAYDWTSTQHASTSTKRPLVTDLRTARTDVSFHDAAGTSLAYVNGTGITETVANVFTRAVCSATVPANAVTARIVTGVLAAAIDEIHYIDAVQFEIGDIPTAYAPKPDEILPGIITSVEVADDAITTSKLIAGAITTAKLAVGAVTANEIAAGSITTLKLAAGAVTANEIAADTITANKIAAGAIGVDELAANSVVAGKIAAGVITATELATNSVTAVKILAESIVADKIATNAVIADKIAANAIIAGKIAAGAVTAGTVAAGVITATEIAANAVIASKISATAIDGKTITGAIIQTVSTAARGIKLDGANNTLKAWDSVGVETVSINGADGVITLKGSITAGSTITGSTITGSSFETSSDGANSVTLVKNGILQFNRADTGALRSRIFMSVDGLRIQGEDTGAGLPTLTLIGSTPEKRAVFNGTLVLAAGTGVDFGHGGKVLRRFNGDVEAVTTNASGIATINHGLAVVPTCVVCTGQNSAGLQVAIESKTSNSFSFNLRSAAGALLASSTRTVNWIAIA